MHVKCRHCGADNNVTVVGSGHITAVCDVCRRPFMVEGPPETGGFGLEELADLDFSAAISQQESLELQRSAGYEPLMPAQRIAPEDMTMTDEQGFLFNAPDASILNPTRSARGQPAPRPADPLDLSFDGSLDGSEDMFGPTEEPTRIVSADIAEVAKAFGQSAEIQMGWRVKSERGLVYELMTIDAVIAWLQGKADTTHIQLSRAGEPFRPVSDFPEVAQRLGYSAPRPTAAAAKEEDGPLLLDEDRLRQRGGARIEPGARQGARGDTPTAPRVNSAIEDPLGLGFVVGLLFACTLLFAGMVLGGLRVGLMSGAPTVDQVAVEPQLPAALQEVEAVMGKGKFTAAVRMLQQLQTKEADPRVHRLMALALYRTNQPQAAAEALARYREAMNASPWM